MAKGESRSGSNSVLIRAVAVLVSQAACANLGDGTASKAGKKREKEGKELLRLQCDHLTCIVFICVL